MSITESSTNEMSELSKTQLRTEFGKALGESLKRFDKALEDSTLKRPEKTALKKAFIADQANIRKMFTAKNKRKINRPTGAKNQGILMSGYFHNDIVSFFKSANLGPLRSYDYTFDDVKEDPTIPDADGKMHHVSCIDTEGVVHFGSAAGGRGRPLKQDKNNPALMESLTMLRDHGVASATELATLFIVYARMNGLKDKGVYRCDAHMEKHLGRVFDFLEAKEPEADKNGKVPKRFDRNAFGQGEISKIPAFYALKNTESMSEAVLEAYGQKVGESGAVFKKSHGLTEKQVKFLFDAEGHIKTEHSDRVAAEFKLVQLANNCLGGRDAPVKVPKAVPETGAQAVPAVAGAKAPRGKKAAAVVATDAVVAAPVTATIAPKPAAKPRAPAKSAAAVVAAPVVAAPVAAKPVPAKAVAAKPVPAKPVPATAAKSAATAVKATPVAAKPVPAKAAPVAAVAAKTAGAKAPARAAAVK